MRPSASVRYQALTIGERRKCRESPSIKRYSLVYLTLNGNRYTIN